MKIVSETKTLLEVEKKTYMGFIIGAAFIVVSLFLPEWWLMLLFGLIGLALALFIPFKTTVAVDTSTKKLTRKSRSILQSQREYSFDSIKRFLIRIRVNTTSSGSSSRRGMSVGGSRRTNTTATFEVQSTTDVSFLGSRPLFNLRVRQGIIGVISGVAGGRNMRFPEYDILEKIAKKCGKELTVLDPLDMAKEAISSIVNKNRDENI